jgi:predicted ATPase
MNSNTQKIVITGGPGTGKTTLIDHFDTKGYEVMEEVSRDVILEARKEGIEQLFLVKPLLFSEKLLHSRLAQFKSTFKEEAFVLFDRGMPDVTAYMDYLGTTYPSHFDETCQNHRYDLIFLLPPWEAIYTQDNERYESFEQAELIYQCLLDGYQKYGYDVIEVPVGTIAERCQYIIDRCSTI